MGLFARIKALSHKPEGLLHKAESVLKQEPVESAPVSFYEQFARDYGYQRFCLLQPNGSVYKLTGAFGISSDSVLSASSTRDFWDGTLFTDNSDWLTYRGEKLIPFLQLFCQEDRDDIRQLILRRVADTSRNLDYIILFPQDAEYDFYTAEEMELSLERINEYLLA